MQRLANRVVLVTGGANGAGAASVRLFCEEGARVAIVDRDEPAGRSLAEAQVRSGYPAVFICADVSRPDQAERAVADTLAAFGRIDVLFNHAGVIIVKPFLDISIAEWDELMDNNAKSAFLVTRAVLPGMLERGQGVLVFTSTTGVRAATHLESAYSASKSAMHSLARSLAVEYRDQGIRSNALCPSFIRTNHGAHEIRQLRDYGIFASENDVNLMQGRICEPEEIAKVALFLASDESSFINGAEIFVDNTFTAV
ncbi:MAG: SDR family NAD(P)-dependent oxidoreductase [Tabrizicola sp.]